MARQDQRLAQAVKSLFATCPIVPFFFVGSRIMIQVAVGHLTRMQKLESELLAKGYKEVGTQSEVGPMEYSKTNDFASSIWSFSLTWNDSEGQ